MGVWGLALLLLLYLSLGLSSASKKSVTVDELGHLPSGFHYLQTGDSRYSSLNPPLVNVLSAVPLLFLELEREPVAPPPSPDPFSFWSIGYRFLEQHEADYLRVYAIARVVPILLVAGLGALLFLWGRQLAPEAPEAAGLLAAGFVCLSPNVLAHARLVGTDTGTAVFVALALWFCRAMLLRPTLGSVLLCGLTLGLAQLTKFYAILLYPALLLIVVGWRRLSPEPRPRLAYLLGCYGAAAGLSLFVLNSGYAWQEFGMSLSELSLQSAGLQPWQASAFGELPIPLPGAYLRAFDAQLVEIDSAIPSFLFGERFQGGRWYYFLAVLALKTPLAFFVTFGLALALSVSTAGSRLPRRELLLLLVYPVLLFTLLSLSEKRQLGARALLSAVPLVQLWVVATIARAGTRRWPLAVAGVALAWILAVSVSSHPDYLSYVNVFFGGSEQGYRHASDANIDIGQDLPQLASYLEREGAEEIQLLYFGSVDPALYGIDYEVPGRSLKPGLLAVSVSLYHMDYPMVDHGQLRSVGPVMTKGLGAPVASIGGSIHVYRIQP